MAAAAAARGASRVEAAQRMWKRWQRVYSSVQVEGGRRGGARNFSILMRGVHTALEIKDRRTGTAESDNFVSLLFGVRGLFHFACGISSLRVRLQRSTRTRAFDCGRGWR